MCYLSVNVFSTKVLIGETIFYVSNWRWDRHFTWSSEPRKGLACCSAKGVPSFLSYFKTLSIGPAQESNLQPPALQSTRSTDWATTAAVNRTLNRTIMVHKAKQDKGGCFAETCCVISTLFSRSSSSSFFPFFFMSSFTSVSSLSTELRPISNNIHLCYLWWCRYLFNYLAACWFCLTHSAFSKFFWISWII